MFINVNGPGSLENNVAGFHLSGLDSATICLVILTLVILSINVGMDLYRIGQQATAASQRPQNTARLATMRRGDLDYKRKSSSHSSQEQRAPVFSSKARHLDNNNNEGTCVFVTFFIIFIAIALIYRALGA